MASTIAVSHRAAASSGLISLSLRLDSNYESARRRLGVMLLPTAITAPYSSERIRSFHISALNSGKIALGSRLRRGNAFEGRYQRLISTSLPSVFTNSLSTHSRSRGERPSRLERIRASAAAGSEGSVPVATKEPFTVTTPLYYVNAAPHMGSAYPTIAADALARFQRLQGRAVTFITGTDEHGEKIALAAAALGRSPREHVDIVAEEYKALWAELDISYDRFVRTTDPRHEKLVAQFFQRVWDSGDIYRDEYEGLYCIACEEYKDEKELLEGQCCPTHRKPCVERKEDNFFFALSKYQQPLEDILAQQEFVKPPFRKNEVLGWVGEGLRDFSISRAAVEWGIPVPADPKQTIYVWFDALLGYVSALLGEGEEVSLEAAVANGWPANVHIIGKDILRFHAVYWPAMLLSAGLPLPKAVFGHGFLTKEGLKMGKSLGNTLDPLDLVRRHGSDAVRFYFLKEIEFGKDGDFAEDRFVNLVNANLANTIGNLLNRTLGLLRKNCGSLIPIDTAALPADHPLRTLTDSSIGKASREFEGLQFGAACEAVLGIATGGNMYLDEKAPWSQFKKGEAEREAAGQDLAAVLEAVRICAVGLSPVTPRLSKRIYLQLGYTEDEVRELTWSDTQWGRLRSGQQMGEGEPVFQRLEDPNAVVEEVPSGKKSKQKRKEKVEVSGPSVLT